MAGGLHGHNGLDPETALQLIRTYILPLLLYGLEVILPGKTLVQKMEMYQRKLLKQVLSLPQNTPDCAIYLLTGFLPIEIQIEKKALILYNNICNLGDNAIEKDLARRQLSVKKNNSNSWFIEIKKILLKYNLSDPIDLLDNPKNKNVWRTEISKSINIVWKENVTTMYSLYKNINYIAIDKYTPGKIHPLLSISCMSARDVNRIPTKLKLLTGTYLLQDQRNRLNIIGSDATCLLCNNEDETIEHFLLRCPQLSNTRSHIINEISRILDDDFKMTLEELSISHQVKILLDCTFLVRRSKEIQKLSKLEFQTRRLLHNLHTTRQKLSMQK